MMFAENLKERHKERQFKGHNYRPYYTDYFDIDNNHFYFTDYNEGKFNPRNMECLALLNKLLLRIKDLVS